MVSKTLTAALCLLVACGGDPKETGVAPTDTETDTPPVTDTDTVDTEDTEDIEDTEDTEHEIPDFDDDAFPASEDTEHDTTRDTADPGAVDTAVFGTSISATDGLFTYEEPRLGGVMGILSVHESPQGCFELFGAEGSYYRIDQFGNKPFPDDLSWYFHAPSVQELEGVYDDCGKAMECFVGYYYLDEQFGPLDGTLDVVSVTDHYVTVTWDNGVSSGGPLTVYNCGDRDIWYAVAGDL